MIIYRTETGYTYNVEIGPKDTVEQLKTILFKLTAIPVNEQILLCDGQALKQKTLEENGLTTKDRNLFLYDKRILDSDSPPPETLPPFVDIKANPVPPLPHNLEFDKSPLLWSLMKYENQFLSHLSAVEAHKRATETRLDFCKAVQSEKTVQFTGLQSAIINLADQYTQIVQGYNSFQNYYSQLQKRHDKLIESFESDIQKLKETPLHNALKTSGMTSLIDYVPENKLRKWKDECVSDHVQLKSKVMDLERLIFTVKDSVEAENRTPPDTGSSSVLYDQLRKGQDIVTEVVMRYQMFANDYKTVKERLQQANAMKVPSNKALWDLCEGLEDAQKGHLQYLSTIREQSEAMNNVVNYFVATKTEATQLVYTRLRIISHLQSRLRDVAGKVYVYHESLVKQKQAFHQLIYVHSMPKAYHAALEEVVRRRKYGKKVQSFLQKVNDLLSKLREEEKSLRVNFLNTYGTFIPKDLIPGLGDSVPHLELNVPPFDSSLPAIDFDNSINRSDDQDISILFNESQRIQELAQENARLMNELRSIKSSTMPSMIANMNSPPTGPHDILRLQADLAESQDLSGDYRKRIENLEAQLSTTYSQIEQAEQLVKQFKEMYEHSQIRLSQIGTVQTHTEQAEEKLKEAQSELVQMANKLRDLEVRVKGHEEKETELTVSNKSLEEKNLEQEKIITDSQNEVENLRKVISEHQSKMETLNEIVSTLEEKSEQQETEIEKLKSELLDSKNESEVIKSDSLGTILKFENMEKELNKKLETVYQTVTELQQTISNNEKMIENLKSNIQEKEDAMNISSVDASQNIEKLNNRIAQLQNELDSKNKSAAAELEKKVLEISDLQKSLEKEKLEKSGLTNVSDSLTAKIQDLTKKLKESAQSMELLTEQAQIAVTEKGKLENKVDDLIDKNQTLTDSLEVSRLKLERILSENKTLTSNLSKRETDLVSQIEDCKKQLESQKKIFAEETEKYQSTAKVLTEELQQMHSILEHAKTENSYKENSWLEQKKEFKNKLDKLESEVSDLQIKLKNCEDNAGKIEKERASLAAQCEMSQKKLAKSEQELLSTSTLLQITSQDAEASAAMQDKIQQLKAELDISHKNVAAMTQRYLQATQQLQSITKKSNDTEKQLSQVETETHRKNEDHIRQQNLIKIQQEELQKYRNGYLEIENLLPALKGNNNLVASNLDNSNHKSEDIIQVIKSRLENMLNDYEKDKKESHQIQLALQLENQERDKKLNDLQNENSTLALALSESPKASIAVKNFKPNDYILFLFKETGKKEGEGHYEAYNEGSPHYYLSPMVYDAFEDLRKKKAPIVGQIIEIMSVKATGNNNPFSVPRDSTFNEVIITR